MTKWRLVKAYDFRELLSKRRYFKVLSSHGVDRGRNPQFSIDYVEIKQKLTYLFCESSPTSGVQIKIFTFQIGYHFFLLKTNRSHPFQSKISDNTYIDLNEHIFKKRNRTIIQVARHDAFKHDRGGIVRRDRHWAPDADLDTVTLANTTIED